jgi:membrane-bound metal-dependent hydrolase YbcI (DUF457 family)
MMGYTHVVGGAATGLAVSWAAGLGFEGAVALTAGAVATSKLPDVDAKINRSPDHRSFPHTLIVGGGAAVVVACIAYVWLWANASGLAVGPLSAGEVALIAPGGAIGYLTHLALDAATSSGIWLLVPKDRRIGLPRKYAIRTGGLGELTVLGVMLVGAFTLGFGVLGGAGLASVSGAALEGMVIRGG